MNREIDGRFTFRTKAGDVIKTAELRVEPGALVATNSALGLEIDATTAVPAWDGHVCDYGVAVEGLLIRDGYIESGSAEPLARDVDDRCDRVVGLMTS